MGRSPERAPKPGAGVARCLAPKLARTARRWTNIGVTGACFREKADLKGPALVHGTDFRTNPSPGRPFRSEILGDHRF